MVGGCYWGLLSLLRFLHCSLLWLLRYTCEEFGKSFKNEAASPRRETVFVVIVATMGLIIVMVVIVIVMHNDTPSSRRLPSWKGHSSVASMFAACSR